MSEKGVETQNLTETRQVSLRSIKDGDFYVRSDDDLAPLCESIKEYGLRREPYVTPVGKQFEIVSGHRRIHALKKLGWKKVKCRIVKGSKQELLAEALVENHTSKSYNPLEEARAFKLWIDKFKLSQRALEKLTGVDQSTISTRLSLLELPPKIIKMIETKKLDSSKAIELTYLPESMKKYRETLAEEIAPFNCRIFLYL